MSKDPRCCEKPYSDSDPWKGRTWNQTTTAEIEQAFLKGDDPTLKSENSFRMNLRAYTADNMYKELNIAMATGKFSKTDEYFCAMAAGLEKNGENYKAQGSWENFNFYEKQSKEDKLKNIPPAVKEVIPK